MRYFDPDALRTKALRYYKRGKVQAAYLQNDESFFPLRLGIKTPSEKTIRSDFTRIRNEIKRLEISGFPLEYKSFHFASLGEQRLPVAVLFPTREAYLKLLGLGGAFASFVQESAILLDAFGSLRHLLIEKPKLIEEYIGDWQRIVAVCRYLTEYPYPNIYLRQLPIEGVDTKFIASRKKVIDLLLMHLLPKSAYREDVTTLANGGFERKYGFLTPQPMVRFRLLDPACYIAGQEELALPEAAFASLYPDIETLFVIENLATFLAFPAYPKSMAIFGSGYGARYLKSAQWMKDKRLFYWGDLDSHGFAILSQFREFFDNVKSIMMDRETAKRFSHLAVEEPKEKRFEGKAAMLTEEELELFDELRRKHFRLEQERIPLTYLQEYIAKKRLFSEKRF